MNRKKLMTVLAAVMIAITLIAPMVALPVMAVDPSTWYTTEDGVLGTDYYALYPYAKKSLNIGFSQFGEMIGIPEGADQADQANWVGLEYDGRDPFCPADVVPMESWINGWFLDIQYIDPSREGALRDRNLFAFAMFADGDAWGKDWQWAKTSHSAPHGGRKTNGSCTTEPLKILYDGPRRWVAQSVTHVYDAEGATYWPVVDVTITCIFNKAEKEVVLLKDIKLKIPKTHLYGKLDCEFSNREEYDLGKSPGYSSYAHYYDQEGTTCYGPDWHMATDLLSKYIEHRTQTVANTKAFVVGDQVPVQARVAKNFLKVYVDGVFQYPGENYNIDWTVGPPFTVNFVVAPDVGDDIEFHFKYIIKSTGTRATGLNVPDWDHEYDIAQVISSDLKYVAWTGIWPPASSFTVDGLLRFLDPLTEPAHQNMYDMDYEPKQSPLIIAEWDILMEHEDIPQFRCVEVKGVTDRHDAADATGSQHTGGVIDREAEFQLDEIFMPWDLLDAVHKQEKRWLYKDTIDETTGSTETVYLERGLGDDLYYAFYASEYTAAGLAGPGWTGYFVREGEGAANYPVESAWVNAFEDGTDYTAWSKNWSLHLTGDTDSYELLKVTPIRDPAHSPPTSAAPLTLQLKDLVDFGFSYKVTSAATWGPHMEFKVYSGPDPVTAADNAIIQHDTNNPSKTTNTWYHMTLNTIDNFVGGGRDADTAFNLQSATAGTGLAGNVGEWHSWEWYTSKLGDYYVQYVGVQAWAASNCEALIDDLRVTHLDRPSGIRYERVYNMEEDKLIPSDWDDYCTFAERVLVDGELIAREDYQNIDPTKTTGHRPYYMVNFETGLLTFYEWSSSYVLWDIEGLDVKVLYSTIEENEQGRYEWTVVGRDASTVDSLGASLVTAAFKNKDRQLGLAGMDMNSSTVYDWIPSVMRKFGTGNTVADYKDSPASPGLRAAKRDDWCTKWPVSSSDMLGIGGPLANLMAYYDNDFTDAFYAIDDFAHTLWDDKIIALSCWDFNTYASNSTHGYAVITTTKDKNGTVEFLVWGQWGRDTYYACQWLHGDYVRFDPGIWQLQEAPDCLTSIILKIRYKPEHPTFSIVECLGTVTEREWIHDSEVKGGIHDP